VRRYRDRSNGAPAAGCLRHRVPRLDNDGLAARCKPPPFRVGSLTCFTRTSVAFNRCRVYVLVQVSWQYAQNPTISTSSLFILRYTERITVDHRHRSMRFSRPIQRRCTSRDATIRDNLHSCQRTLTTSRSARRDCTRSMHKEVALQRGHYSRI
jgi:hypothetical protein